MKDQSTTRGNKMVNFTEISDTIEYMRTHDYCEADVKSVVDLLEETSKQLAECLVENHEVHLKISQLS
mgnify:FL=1